MRFLHRPVFALPMLNAYGNEVLKLDSRAEVANQDAKTLRTGGGYILNSMAKVEAQAFLRELRLWAKSALSHLSHWVSSQGERPSWAVMRCCILKHTVNEIKRANKLKQRKKLIGLVLFILLVSCQNTERDPKWQHFSGVDMINTRVWDPKRPSTCGDFLITTFDQWDLGAKLIFQALNGSSIPMSTSITSFFSFGCETCD